VDAGGKPITCRIGRCEGEFDWTWTQHTGWKVDELSEPGSPDLDNSRLVTARNNDRIVGRIVVNRIDVRPVAAGSRPRNIAKGIFGFNSSRHQSAVIKIGRDKAVKWILSAPNGWNDQLKGNSPSQRPMRQVIGLPPASTGVRTLPLS